MNNYLLLEIFFMAYICIQRKYKMFLLRVAGNRNRNTKNFECVLRTRDTARQSGA